MNIMRYARNAANAERGENKKNETTMRAIIQERKE